MDRIQEKTVKFLTDVRRKKVSVESKTERNDCKKEPMVKNVFIHNSNISSNNCSSCQKVFYSPNLLLKHIMRRHPDDLIQLHRKCLKPESNDNSLGLHDVVKVFQSDLSKLREELIVTIKSIKVPQSGHLDSSKEESYLYKKYESQQLASTSMDHKCGDWHNANDSGSNELQIVKQKVIDLESNIQCLCNKFEELDTLVKDKMLSKQDIHNLITANESKILKTREVQFLELRSTLHDKLNNMLSNQLQQNSIELQSQYSKLKEDIARIDQLIDSVRKQVDSPYYLKNLEKKLDDRIINFLGRNSRSKGAISKSRLSKYRNKSDVPRHTLSFLKNKENKVKKPESDLETPHIAENFSQNCVSHSNKLGAFELTCMLEEKMSSLGISPSTCKMSSHEYKGKMKLIEFEKKQLLEKNRNFLKKHDEINLLADYRTKLQQKKCRKLRFSVPLISNKNRSNSNKILNKTYPNVENDSLTFSEPSKSVYLKSNLENIQNVTSDINSCKFISDISKSKSDKCFRGFQETHICKNELQSTPLKECESTRIADCPLTFEHYEYEEKLYSLAQDSESSSNTLELEDHKDIGIAEPVKYFPKENLSDASSLSEWEGDKDN